MPRDFKIKLRIIWLLLRNQYTNSDRHKCFWLWDSHTLITFDKETFEKRGT